MGALEAGINVIFAVELDRNAAASYRKNICERITLGATTLYENDLNLLDPNELKDRHFGAQDCCDILLGGPPCQGFSTHRIKNSGIDDPRNSLIYRYFDFIKALQPKVFLMENVPGILWERHKSYLDQFYNLAKAAGYKLMKPQIIDAQFYGVPQRRKRVFILGVRSDVILSDLKWPPETTHAMDEAGKQPLLSCSDVFAPAPKGDFNDVHMNHGPELIKAFANTPLNGGSRYESGRTLPCHENHDGHKDVYGRMKTSSVAPTMTTACINPSKGRFVHPFENHGITARQAARIQTFPDDFVFEGGLIAAGKQIGNAVPVQLSKIIISEITLALNASRQVSNGGQPEEALAIL